MLFVAIVDFDKQKGDAMDFRDLEISLKPLSALNLLRPKVNTDGTTLAYQFVVAVTRARACGQINPGDQYQMAS